MAARLTLGVRRADDGSEIVRGDNRDKSGINGDFLCIKGRYAFDFANNEDRLTKPLIRQNGRLTPVSWEVALDFAGKETARDSRHARRESNRCHRFQSHDERRELPAAEVCPHRVATRTTLTTTVRPTTSASLKSARWKGKQAPPLCATHQRLPPFCSPRQRPDRAASGCSPGTCARMSG